MSILSLLDLRSYDASTILDNSFLEDYKRGMQLFYSELVNLNTNIFIINKINQFPFGLFCTPANTIFFSTVLKNLYDVCILTITKLATDKAGDLSTLLQFKNQVVRFIKPEFKDALIETLKQHKFNNNIEKMLGSASSLRNSRIAHLKIDTIFNDEIKRLKIDELVELANILNLLLQAVSFNVEQLMLPLPYTEYNKRTTDIESILDNLAINSNIIRLPDLIPVDAWDRRKKKMKQKEIETLNVYRKKFNLSEI